MRGKKAKKIIIQADPILKSKTVTRMINLVMLDGKKSVAEGIVYEAIRKLHEDEKEATKLFENAVKKIMPEVEVRSRRVGGATYQVPMPVKHDRSEALAIRWIVSSARNKSGKTMSERLFEELRNVNDNIGDAIKKKDDAHRMAEANRAFAHFARY